MVLTLAFRNLVHDRMRLVVTLVGIMFSVVLVAVQLGLYFGAQTMIVNTIDQTDADLWVMPRGTKSFVDSSPLRGREKHAALSTPGIAEVAELVVVAIEWRKPEGGGTPIVLLGIEPSGIGLQPWNIISGNAADLTTPDGVAVDKSYLDDLGVKKVGDIAQIENQKVRVVAITEKIRSFTTMPYVFMTLSQARRYLNAPHHFSSYLLLRVAKGQDIEAVRQRLIDRMDEVDVLTTREFRDRTLNQWLFATGAGYALIIGAVLGLIVGTVIVAQTLYASTKDHLNEFATLRALGSTTRYIMSVILGQAIFSAVIGYIIAMFIVVAVVKASADSAMPIIMTAPLAVGLLGLTVLMCALSAVSAIAKVTRIDPAMVFGR
ncbi:MAG: ABC transporter permease [Hyphomicrobiaceae bacterium]|nr:ABC transporter permease [Hyphomicrobiaceae bacterium]